MKIENWHYRFLFWPWLDFLYRRRYSNSHRMKNFPTDTIGLLLKPLMAKGHLKLILFFKYFHTMTDRRGADIKETL